MNTNKIDVLKKAIVAMMVAMDLVHGSCYGADALQENCDDCKQTKSCDTFIDWLVFLLLESEEHDG